MVEPHKIQSMRAEFEWELLESVLPFWERYSPDWEHGGYFNHLDYDGQVYDPTKNVWLQARQVWLFSKLSNNELGGLFYFLDAGGYSPTQLEWDMKLWWPHCEAMVAFLMLYSIERERSDWDKFILIKEYAFSHFSDSEHGEWFGYLNRRGEVTQRFKGGPYKGCFHVPRALWLCWKLLARL